MTKNETLAKLQELENSLANLKALPKKDEEINMFTVFHLQSAERHHSSFFAGLLAPKNFCIICGMIRCEKRRRAAHPVR